MNLEQRLALNGTSLREFCRKWSITELAVFGSVLRDDFRRESDVDFLATFDPKCRWSLLDQVRMQGELAGMLGRPVDLVSRRGLETSRNPWRREAILTTAETINVA
jgi:hypothetical protein